jgi:hypothetical protein
MEKLTAEQVKDGKVCNNKSCTNCLTKDYQGGECIVRLATELESTRAELEEAQKCNVWNGAPERATLADAHYYNSQVGCVGKKHFKRTLPKTIEQETIEKAVERFAGDCINLTVEQKIFLYSLIEDSIDKVSKERTK